MRVALKIVKWLVIVLLFVFVLIQFWRPTRSNPPVDQSLALQAHQQVSTQIAGILDRSCQDCHANTTRWPWYTNVAPVSWFIADHVNEGRKQLNLSEWGKLPPNRRQKKLQEICEQVEEGFMPLNTYTPLHPGSKLSSEDVKLLCDWTNAERNRIVDNREPVQ